MSRVIWVRYWDETEPPWDQGDVPWIVRIAVRWGITIVAFLVARVFVNWLYSPDRFFLDGAAAVLLAPAIFVVVRAVLRPILLLLTCPLQIITLPYGFLVIAALVVRV